MKKVVREMHEKFDSSQWNIPIVLNTLECQINKYLCLVYTKTVDSVFRAL